MYQGENHCGTESSIIIYQVSQSSPPIFSSKPPIHIYINSEIPNIWDPLNKWILNLSLGSLNIKNSPNLPIPKKQKSQKYGIPKIHPKKIFTNPKKNRNPKILIIRHPQFIHQFIHPKSPLAPVGQHRIEDFLQQGHILGLQALVRSLEPWSQRRANVVTSGRRWPPSFSGLLLRSSKIHTRYLVYIYIISLSNLVLYIYIHIYIYICSTVICAYIYIHYYMIICTLYIYIVHLIHACIWIHIYMYIFIWILTAQV